MASLASGSSSRKTKRSQGALTGHCRKTTLHARSSSSWRSCNSKTPGPWGPCSPPPCPRKMQSGPEAGPGRSAASCGVGCRTTGRAARSEPRPPSPLRCGLSV
nr:galanin and GMAP prepropeptide [Rousettus aegyptiacus]